MKLYTLYCKTEKTYKEVIAGDTTEPTKCPDDGSHEIMSIGVLREGVTTNLPHPSGGNYPKELTVAEEKELRYNEIDAKTRELITAGFEFEGNVFSLSGNAQLNWSEVHTNQNQFTFPLAISMKNHDTYDIPQNKVQPFWSAAKDTVKGHLDSGRVLKKSVFDATTKAQVNAVIDNR